MFHSENLINKLNVNTFGGYHSLEYWRNMEIDTYNLRTTQPPGMFPCDHPYKFYLVITLKNYGNNEEPASVIRFCRFSGRAVHHLLVLGKSIVRSLFQIYVIFGTIVSAEKETGDLNVPQNILVVQTIPYLYRQQNTTKRKVSVLFASYLSQ